MYLKTISLLNFKNYEESSLEFSKKINCFVGNNGAGKTNILDAVYYLSFCKSYFNPIDSQNIKHGAPFFVVEGIFEKDDKEDHIYCGLKKGQKKAFKKNKKEYERLADHIGSYPAVIISPADRDLITEGSDVRRKFLDSVISQSDKIYLDDLINYNKALSQRNALLKYFNANSTFDSNTLEVYNTQLINLGTVIHEKRAAFVEKLQPIFDEYYKAISKDNEVVKLAYVSNHFAGEYSKQLADSLQRDMAVQYTTKGIHKDDLEFTIEGYPIKKMGSQGQQKSFLIALKLAQFDFIKELNGYKPLLLLDDIFDKLDENRVEEIIKLVNEHHFGQIFITDTHPERTENIIKRINEDYKLFTVTKGTVE